MEKIGCGIVTCNRPKGLNKLLESISEIFLDEVVVVNDGGDYIKELNRGVLINNTSNLGVGRSKNIAIQYLLDKGCDHLFIIEDDVFVKDAKVFERYISASKISGLQHFNFSQHGLLNKDCKGRPKPRLMVDYGEVRLGLYKHCVGAFSYYSRACLHRAGLMDSAYFNALEHVDHTLKIINEGLHPAFWFFADIEGSDNYIGDEAWSLSQSRIASSPYHARQVAAAIEVFKGKHGVNPGDYPLESHEVVESQLKNIKKEYAAGKGEVRVSVTIY